MSYRKFYKDYYGIEFDKNYEIHHIDGNRENNSIQNLLLLPAELHREYHRLLDFLIPYDSKTKKVVDLKIFSNQASSGSWELHVLEDIVKVKKECAKWYDYKLYLDGVLGNVHHILFERRDKR